MQTSDLITAIEALAPPALAEPWDNTGLLVGHRDRELNGPTLLAIDLSPAVVDEALALGAGAVVAYHPPIFHPLQNLSADTPQGLSLLRLIEAGIAVYSPHTALDATTGGVADWLADMLLPRTAPAASDTASTGNNTNSTSAGGGDRRALQAAVPPSSNTHKIVVFVPKSHAETLRDALASIGAGSIGNYERCSFTLEGRGSFIGAADKTNPTVGQAGQLETIEEVRLEMVCSDRALPLAHEIVRTFHPYEEPAWDIYPLETPPNRSLGPGRRLTLDQPATPTELAQRLKENLGLDAVKLAAATDKPILRIGLCPGAGVSLLDTAIEQECSLFLTGEMRHHETMKALSRGCSVLLAGHTNTERGYLPVLAAKLNAINPDLHAQPSTADVSSFKTL